MSLSQMQVFNKYFMPATIETLAQMVEKFNAASGGAIRLTTEGFEGDFLQESFYAAIHAARRRVDRYASNGTANPTDLTQLKHSTVKVAGGFGPVRYEPSQMTWLNKPTAEGVEVASRNFAEALLQDQLNTSIAALVAAIGNQGAATTVDVSATKKVDYWLQETHDAIDSPHLLEVHAWEVDEGIPDQHGDSRYLHWRHRHLWRAPSCSLALVFDVPRYSPCRSSACLHDHLGRRSSLLRITPAHLEPPRLVAPIAHGFRSAGIVSRDTGLDVSGLPGLVRAADAANDPILSIGRDDLGSDAKHRQTTDLDAFEIDERRLAELLRRRRAGHKWIGRMDLAGQRRHPFEMLPSRRYPAGNLVTREERSNCIHVYASEPGHFAPRIASIFRTA
ncbi:hypothetical protein SAMN02982989_3399 [Xaviernesmea oryzae]|uniref:Uncharacterized protein n=1 Tax=Xaviernesmea oryzae TaxID=464029 RepID=A0A1X7G889_9HYPH|nr:hypothetical protein SAMN02982989_3399 [Xaviernesmea oryzae]